MHIWAIVHHDPGSAYGASFPDVPDCFAAADDQEDLMANAIAALDDYFADGHPYPDPRGIEDIRAAVAEDLAAGAFLMQVPVVRRRTKPVRVNISLERGIVDAIDAEAKRLGLNRSSYIAQATLHEIERA